MTSLPSGQCAGAASCEMTIVVPCDSGGPLYNGYVCACDGGAWECDDKYPDLALCVSHPGGDGGTEAAVDGPAD